MKRGCPQSGYAHEHEAAKRRCDDSRRDLIEQVEKIRALLDEEIDPAESWPVLRAHRAVKSLDSQLKELTDECHVQESKLGVLRRFHEMPPGATVLLFDKRKNGQTMHVYGVVHRLSSESGRALTQYEVPEKQSDQVGYRQSKGRKCCSKRIELFWKGSRLVTKQGSRSLLTYLWGQFDPAVLQCIARDFPAVTVSVQLFCSDGQPWLDEACLGDILTWTPTFTGKGLTFQRAETGRRWVCRENEVLHRTRVHQVVHIACYGFKSTTTTAPSASA